MAKIQGQKQIWNNIAEEWWRFKKTSDPRVMDFVEAADGKMLDLGCGAGRNFAKTKATIYSLDFSVEMLKYARQKAQELGIKAEYVLHDLTKSPLPFQNDFFDAITAIAVLHCIPEKSNRERLLRELYRIIKPKGKMLVKVWNKNNKKFVRKPKENFIKWRGKGARYYYFYDAEELKENLESAGFRIVALEHEKNRFELQEIFAVVEK
jgi:ubiquinone/menaquinone biosynthesis C-methylase UbiE